MSIRWQWGRARVHLRWGKDIFWYISICLICCHYYCQYCYYCYHYYFALFIVILTVSIIYTLPYRTQIQTNTHTIHPLIPLTTLHIYLHKCIHTTIIVMGSPYWTYRQGKSAIRSQWIDSNRIRKSKNSKVGVCVCEIMCMK